jgi:endogenous inhibitor of DNA gyrase (YacG/DUF329 family)
MVMKILSHKLEELPNLKYNTLITVECDYCHQSFHKTSKVLGINIKRGTEHLFCNRTCLNKFTNQNTKRTIHQCKLCGNDVIRRESQVVDSGNVFCSHKCSATHSNQVRYKDHNYKIKITKPKVFKPKLPYNCEQCNKEVLRSEYQISKNKNGFVFCSRSCRMTHQNLNNKKKYGCRKSKAEIYLSNLIKDKFPNIILSENDRSILPSKLEIDIAIPERKLAIELNGPVHYFPIYGENRLKTCQNKDILKQQEIVQLGWSLLAIDVSRLNSKKKTEQFLVEYFESVISPLLK